LKINYFCAKNNEKYIFLRVTPQKIATTRAALFDSNMHQIVCRLGLRPRPHWGSLQRSPNPLAVFRGLLLRGEENGKEKGGKGSKGEEEGVTAL